MSLRCGNFCPRSVCGLPFGRASWLRWSAPGQTRKTRACLLHVCFTPKPGRLEGRPNCPTRAKIRHGADPLLRASRRLPSLPVSRNRSSRPRSERKIVPWVRRWLWKTSEKSLSTRGADIRLMTCEKMVPIARLIGRRSAGLAHQSRRMDAGLGGWVCDRPPRSTSGGRGCGGGSGTRTSRGRGRGVRHGSSCDSLRWPVLHSGRR